jgi:hypothetical protein
MMWQRWQESRDHFRFVIVRFPDVTDELLNQALPALQHREIQRITLPSLFRDDSDQAVNGEVQAETAAATSKVVRAMERLSVTRSIHFIEEHLVRTLSIKIQVTSDLRVFCDLLKVSHAILTRGKEDACRLIIRRLLDSEKQIGGERLAELRATVEQLMAVLPNDQLQRFINYLMPFYWVNTEAAARLCRLAYRTEGSKAVVWKRNWLLSEKMYLCRGWCKLLSRVVKVDTKSGDIEDWKTKLREALAIAFYLDPATTSIDKLRCRVRNFLDKTGEPIWIVLSAMHTGRDVIERLMAEWPEVRFFVFELQDEKAGLADGEWSGFDRVTPTLDFSVEDDAAEAWGDLMNQAGVARENIMKGEVFA